MSLSVKICTEREEWDQFVESTPQGTIFHKWDFLRIMEKHNVKRIGGRKTVGKLYPLIAYKGNEPVAVYPFFIYDYFSVKFLASPPGHVESIYLGPVMMVRENTKPSKIEGNLIDLQEAADSFIYKNFKPISSFINIQPGITDSRPFKWAGYAVEPRHSYLLDLTEGVDNVWQGLHTELRKKIHKIQADGVQVQKGSIDDLDHIYDSLAHRRARQGISMTCSIDYLKEVCESLGGQADIRIARKDGKYLGGLVNLLYLDRAYSWVGSAKNQNGVDANELLTWESIKHACEKNYKSYEIMGADSPNLIQFKTRYNGKLITYLSCRKYQPHYLKIVETAYKSVKKTRYKPEN
jgi:hypothetical protein